MEHLPVMHTLDNGPSPLSKIDRAQEKIEITTVRREAEAVKCYTVRWMIIDRSKI